MAEKASPHKKEKQPPIKMPQSAKESKTSLKRRLFNTSVNGEDQDKKASKPAPKRKKPGSQPGSPTLLGTPGRTIPLSERQQLALLMQMTANEENSNPVPVQTPQSKNSHNPTTPNSSGGVKNKVNKRNERGETALHMAAIKGDAQMAHNLINQGAEVNVQDFAGWTPLHEACNHGYYDVAKVLIKAGASVNTMGLEDDTPLHDAAVNGHVKVVKLLLKHGANPLQMNKRGKCPLDIACSTEIHSLMRLEIIASSSDSSDQVVRSPSSPESLASPHPITVHNNINNKVVKNGTELPEDPYEFTQDSGSSEQKITIHWASPDKSGKGANVMEITRTIPKVRDIGAPNSVSSTTTSESDLFDPHLTSTSSKLECVEEERKQPSPSISTSVTPLERTIDSLPVTRVMLTEVKEDSDSCVSETNLYISDDSNMAGDNKESKADSTTVNDGILTWNLKKSTNDNGPISKVISSLRNESARVTCSAPSPQTDGQSSSDSAAAVSPYDFNANENEVRTMETTLSRPDPLSNRSRFSPTRSSPVQSTHTASSKHSEPPAVCDSLSVQQESVSSNCVQTSGIHSPGKQSSGHESERSDPDSDQRTETRRESPSQSIPDSRERSESDSSHETNNKHHGKDKTKKHRDRSQRSHKKHHRHHSHSSRKEEKMDTSEEATTSTQSAVEQVKEDSKTHEKVSSPQVGEETQEQSSRKSPDRRSPFPAVAREYYIVSPPSSGDNAGEIKSLLLRISSDASHKSKDNTSSSTSSVSSTSASGSNNGNHKNDTKSLGNVNERTSGSIGENGNARKSPVNKEAERRRSPARGSPDVTSSVNGTGRSGSPKGNEKPVDKNDKNEKSNDSSTTEEKPTSKVTRTLRSNSALTTNGDSNGNEEKKDEKDKPTFSQPMTRSRRNQVEAAAAAAASNTNSNMANNAEANMESHPRKRKIARHRQNQQMEEANHGSTVHQEKTNSIEAFLNIRQQVAERQKTLMASVQPKPPNGYKEYLMYRKNYLLQSDPDNKIGQVIPRMSAPVSLTNGLLGQFSEQEKIRHELRLRHYIEREKLMLAAEQDIVRVHGRAARALVNQTIPFSVCTVLKDLEIYNMPDPLPLEDKSSIRQRFNGRQFISWLQDVDEKYEKLKEELLQRHQHEAASLYAIQKLEWELKLQELKQWDSKSPPQVHSSHVPIVEVNRDFDLLPA